MIDGCGLLWCDRGWLCRPVAESGQLYVELPVLPFGDGPEGVRSAHDGGHRYSPVGLQVDQAAEIQPALEGATNVASGHEELARELVGLALLPVGRNVVHHDVSHLVGDRVALPVGRRAKVQKEERVSARHPLTNSIELASGQVTTYDQASSRLDCTDQARYRARSDVPASTDLAGSVFRGVEIINFYLGEPVRQLRTGRTQQGLELNPR